MPLKLIPPISAPVMFRFANTLFEKLAPDKSTFGPIKYPPEEVVDMIE